ncbi:unnamed protein product, partial [Vitis vinifera]
MLRLCVGDYRLSRWQKIVLSWGGVESSFLFMLIWVLLIFLGSKL